MNLASFVLPFPLNLIWGFLKGIPWQVWAVLAAGIAFMIWLGAHDHALGAKVEGERDAYWGAREKAANDKYAADMNRKRGEIADLVLAGIAARDQLEATIRAQAASFDAEMTRIKNRRPAYVTPLADSRCVVPRGFVLQFNASASAANGSPGTHDPGPPEAGTELVDAPAGIALSAVSDAVTGTQQALGECRRQVTGWQQFYSTVLVPWHESLARTLKGAP